MLNEGIITSDNSALVKSQMVKALRTLGETTPERWEALTFEAITGASRDEIDWEVEDNKAGYFLWIKGFDSLIDELVDEGYAVVEKVEGSDERKIRIGNESDESIAWSQLVYPPGPQ